MEGAKRALNELGQVLDGPRFHEDGRRIYEPNGEYLSGFLIDRSPVAIIRGPWGSGTSTACCQRLFSHAAEQYTDKTDGKKRSKWVIVRDTYPQLEQTTMETWLTWFPEKQYGKMHRGSKPWFHEIRIGDIELDVIFKALEGTDAIAELLSLEPTGFWFNEIETVPLKLFTSAIGRTGRFPRMEDGGSRWSGAIADLNAPPDNHWLPIMMREAPPPEDLLPGEELQYKRPPGWAYFVQPPAMIEKKDVHGRVVGYDLNPKAENLKFLPYGYYQKQTEGRPKRTIDAYVLNKIVPLVEGDAVWKQYNQDVHRSIEPLDPVPGHPVYIGLDFGRRPAALFAQLINNRWLFQFEVIGKDMSSVRFAPLVQRMLQQKYPGYQSYLYGDPKGQDKGQQTETTAYDVFRSFGMNVRPAPIKGNHIQTRIDTIDYLLTQQSFGLSRFLVSPRCITFLSALGGGYRYPPVKPTVGEDREPIKDRYSDIADASQYLVIGAGEGRAMKGFGGGNFNRPVVTTPQRRTRRRFVA